MRKTVKLTPLAEIGSGTAYITDDTVSIEISGINGGMKAWLTGGEAVPIGNIVGGKLSKNISTTGHNGILITQSGRQMLYSSFDGDGHIEEKADNVFSFGKYKWKKITSPRFASQKTAVKYVLSNQQIYENFKENGFYWFAEDGDDCLIALFCNTDQNPFDFMGEKGTLKNNHRIIGINIEGNYLFLPKEENNY